MPTIAYCISSHGYGHAARSRAIIESLLDRRFGIIVKTLTPAEFFQDFRGRPFEILAETFDCGCLQLDAQRIDWPGTFAAYRQIEKANAAKLADEVEFLKRRRISAVVCDVPSFPALAAARAGIPCLVVANFTWADIYEDHARRDPVVRGIVERIKEEYAQSSLLLRTAMGFEMPYFPRIMDVPIIASGGRSAREALCARLGLPPERPLYLIYVGRWGLQTMQWEKLAAMTEARFITMMALEGALPFNLSVVDSRDFRHADLTASVNAVIAKPGYGICSECLAAGVPLLYTGRQDFAEFAPMERDLLRWGGAIRLPEEDFVQFNLPPYLGRIPELRMDKYAFRVDGAETCARIIAEYAC